MVAAAVVGSAVVGAAASKSASKKAASASQYAVDASSDAADRQADLAERQYDDYYNDVRPGQLADAKWASERARTVAGQADQLYADQMDDASFYRDRFRNTQVPLEDEIISNARKLGTADEQDRLSGLAVADTRGAFADMRAMSARASARQGLNPGSGAAQALAEEAFAAEALTGASNGTKSRFAAMDRYRSGLTDAAALGRGLPGFSSSSSGGATAAGGLSLQAAPVGVGAYGAFQGTANGAMSTAGGLWGNSANTAAVGVNAFNQSLQTAYKDPMQSVYGSVAGLGTSYAGLQYGIKPGG
jgi:hypothetical protein